MRMPPTALRGTVAAVLLAAATATSTTSPPIRVDDAQLILTEVMNLDGSRLEVHFSMIGSIEATDRGGFFVFDPVVQSLYLFDRDGEGAREIGRRGEGPGEFIRGYRMWISGERLTVFDIGQSLLHCAEGIGSACPRHESDSTLSMARCIRPGES